MHPLDGHDRPSLVPQVVDDEDLAVAQAVVGRELDFQRGQPNVVRWPGSPGRVRRGQHFLSFSASAIMPPGMMPPRDGEDGVIGVLSLKINQDQFFRFSPGRCRFIGQ